MNDQKKAVPRIALQTVESSQIHSIGHDPASNTLAIRFKNWKGEPTSLYHYENFTAEDFAAFQGAKSIGAHFGQNIKRAADRFPFTRINEADLAEQADESAEG